MRPRTTTITIATYSILTLVGAAPLTLPDQLAPGAPPAMPISELPGAACVTMPAPAPSSPMPATAVTATVNSTAQTATTSSAH